MLTHVLSVSCIAACLAPMQPDGATIDRYRQTADRIIEASRISNGAYDKLEHLCDDVGNRISGSAALDRAIDWAVDTLKREGQENVHTEKVMVPHWVRGSESLVMTQPRQHNITMLG